MTVAARLSENANINVGVIEAGIFHHHDPLIDVPGMSCGTDKLQYDSISRRKQHLAARFLGIPTTIGFLRQSLKFMRLVE